MVSENDYDLPILPNRKLGKIRLSTKPLKRGKPSLPIGMEEDNASKISDERDQ